MNDLLPKPLREAQDKGIEFVMGEEYEWKLKFKASSECIEKIIGSPVCIFANNGFGDYLFLKKKRNEDEFGEDVFEFFHEGPEINPVAESLNSFLGLKERPPSADTYPKAVYDTGELVQLADHVQVKVWAEFWKGWQDGVVDYVPGDSNRKPQHERGGLKWVAIQFRNGQICPLVDPKNGKLRKVKFVRRGSTDDKQKRVEQTRRGEPDEDVPVDN